MGIKEKLFSSGKNGPGLRAVAQWLWGITIGQRTRLISSCLVGVLEVACNLSFVWTSKMVIDIATGAIEGNLLYACIITVLLLIAQLVFAGVDMWLSSCIPVDISNKLRRRLFGHLLRSRWKELERYHSGDVLNRISRDMDDVVRLIATSIPAVIVTAVQFVASFIFLAKLDSSLAWLLIFIIPVFLLISRLYFRKMREYNMRIRKSDSNIQSVIQESIQHHVVIKTMERRSNRLSLLDGLQAGLRNQVIKRTRLSLFSRMMMSSGFNGGYLLVFFWGAVRLSHGDMTFGSMTAFLQLVGRIQRPVYDLATFLPTFITAYTAAERLMELEAFPVEDDANSVAIKAPVGLRFENVCFAYTEEDGGVINNLNLEFPAGTTTAVLGETGAGKTTLVRLILSLLSPQKGTIKLIGEDQEVEISPRTRTNFVYVPQGNTLFSGTIRDNLLMGDPGATDEEMETVLRIAAADFVLSLPDGLDTVLNERGGGLSEGQAQRISIARALLRKGAILLFDEATSALDQDTERSLVANLREYCVGKTVIFITHHPELAKECDRVYRID